MKQIKTKSKDIICVEVPEDSYDFTIYDNGVYFKPTLIQYNEYGEINPHPSVNFKTYNLKLKIIGKLSELTDKDCEEFVEKMPFSFSDRYLLYIPYLYSPEHTKSAKESFMSLLQSEGIDTSKEDKLLIIKML